MPRESVDEKAARYLVSGRLRILGKRGGRIYATCVGSEGVMYHLGYQRGRWWCHCPARVGRCCHITALQLVVDEPGAQDEGGEAA